MNQSQKTSLITNQELRKEYTIKVCELLNKYMPEEAQFTQKQIEEFANDKTIVNNYKAHDELLKDSEKQKKAFAEEIKTSIDNRDKGSRFGYLLCTTGETLEDETLNEEYRIKKTNITTKADMANDMVMDLLNEDMNNFYPKDVATSINYMKSNYKNAIGGFLFTSNDLLGSINEDNPELAEVCTNFLSFYQGNANNTIDDVYKNPLCMIIPSSTQYATELYGAMTAADKELRKIVAELAEKTEDFEVYNNIEEQFKAGYASGFATSSFLNNGYFNKELSPNNIIARSLVQKGIINKNTIFEKQFVMNGKVVPASEALKHIDPKTLKFKDGLKLEPLPEETKQKIFANNTVLKLKSNEIIDKETLSRLEGKNYQGDFSHLKENLEKMTKKMDEFNKHLDELKKANPDKAKDIERSEYLKLKEDPTYSALRSEINKETHALNKSIIHERKPALKDYDKLTFTKDQIKAEGKKLNYAALANQTLNIYGSMTTGKTKSAYYGEKQKELNEKFGKDKFVQDLNHQTKWKLNDTSLKESLKSIAMINQKDEEYQNRGRIGKWWYRNSHNRMMENKKIMVDFLDKQGVDMTNIDSLGLDDKKMSFGKVYGEYNDKIDQELSEFNKKVDDIYEKYIEEPLAYKESLNKELPQLNNKLKENEKIQRDARNEFVEYYKKEGINKETIPNFDEAKYSTYQDAFRKWLNEPTQSELKANYNEAKETYGNTLKEVNEIKIKTEAIDKSFSSGIPYYPIKQENDIVKNINNDIKKESKDIKITKDLQSEKTLAAEKSDITKQ